MLGRKHEPMPHRLSPKAEEDLERIYLEGYYNFGERQANDYIRDLVRIFELIGANPRMARLRYEVVPPARVHPHRSHLIIYEEIDDLVVILRIRHARENWTEKPV